MPEFLTKFIAFFKEKFKEKPYRLLWAGAVLIILLLVFFYSFLLAPSLKDIKKGVVDVHLEMAKNVQSRSEGFLSEHINALNDLAQSLVVCQNLAVCKENEKTPFIDRFMKERSGFYEIYLLSEQGKELLRRSQRTVFAANTMRDLSWSEIFVKPMEDKIYLSPVYISQESLPVLTVAVPLKPVEGKISGVLVGELSLQRIWDTISRVKIGTSGLAYIVDSRGYLIAHPDLLLVLKKTNLFSRPAVEKVLIGKRIVDGTEKDDEYLNEKGQKSYVAGIYWPETHWGLFVEEPSQDTWASYRKTQNLGLASIGGMAILLLLLFFLIRILSQTNKELEQKYTQLEFQRNELYRTTKMLVQRDLRLSETQSWLKEALVKSDKARIGLEESRAALMNIMEDMKEARLKAEESGKALLNILEDVEEARKTAEEEKNKTQAIIVNFTDGLLVFDPKDRISLINPQAEAFFSVKTEQVAGKHLLELENFPTLEPLVNLLGQKIKKIFRKELPLKENLILEVSTVSIAGGEGESENLVILHNITREKAIERLKTEFVSIAAHQLRTPLSAIKWVIKMVLDGDAGRLNKEQKELLAKGYKSNERIINLVNDLLNVSRIEEGRFGYSFTYGNFQEVLNIVLENAERQIAKNHLQLILNKPEKLPELYLDQDRLVLALQNLVDNAVKYTPEYGKIEISINEQNKNLLVSVKDNGVGIPAKEQAKLFSKFFRASNVVRLQTEGTGLGLFVAKNIIERHGGEITITSQEGLGTTVTFNLPFSHS